VIAPLDPDGGGAALQMLQRLPNTFNPWFKRCNNATRQQVPHRRSRGPRARHPI
jgi:hypothetical protein